MGNVSVQSIGQIAVNVKDVARAVTFYRDIIGLPLLFETNGLAISMWRNTIIIEFAGKPEFDHPRSVLYYKVESLVTTVATMKEAGAEFIDEPQMVGKMGNVEIWMAFFHDTEGNTHAVMSEI